MKGRNELFNNSDYHISFDNQNSTALDHKKNRHLLNEIGAINH